MTEHEEDPWRTVETTLWYLVLLMKVDFFLSENGSYSVFPG